MQTSSKAAGAGSRSASLVMSIGIEASSIDNWREVAVHLNG
jgi:hypothetical protein